MKVIIAGGRDIYDYERVKRAIKDSGWEEQITEVVCGMAKGVDRLGLRWATEKGIPVKKYYANWPQYGKKAGPIRNGKMADYADALILVWDGESPGSGNMLQQAIERGLPYHEDKETIYV